jgi:Tannase and feruloyl esterase
MQKLSIAARVSPGLSGTLSGCLLLIALTHPCEAAESAPLAGKCADLPNLMAGHFPDSSTHLVSATVVNKGTVKVPGPGHTERSAPVPDHCEVIGAAQERDGVGGQHYAIRFHLRLPLEWNGRFFFLAWWREVNRRAAGKANTFARVFPVPGMNHCGGGPATDGFDVMPSLMQWVEKGQAPEQILANADPASPWPTRTRPLCVYPAIARYKGSGDLESAASFECRE